MPNFQIKNLTIYDKEKLLVDLFKGSTNNLLINSSLALVGQSGSGKSLSLKAILDMTPPNLDVKFDNSSDFKLDKQHIGFIPQNPFTSLSPMTQISKQFFLQNHKLCDDKKIDELLKMVKLEPELKNKFPMELSGGQLQRIVIAIALSTKPKLLLLDEPTTALDDDSKLTIINLFKELQKKLHFLMIYVSHDIASIKDICDDIAILNKGVICEYGNTKEILSNPKHSYTKQLIESNFKNREFRV